MCAAHGSRSSAGLPKRTPRPHRGVLPPIHSACSAASASLAAASGGNAAPLCAAAGEEALIRGCSAKRLPLEPAQARCVPFFADGSVESQSRQGSRGIPSLDAAARLPQAAPHPRVRQLSREAPHRIHGPPLSSRSSGDPEWWPQGRTYYLRTGSSTNRLFPDIKRLRKKAHTSGQEHGHCFDAHGYALGKSLSPIQSRLSPICSLHFCSDTLKR